MSYVLLVVACLVGPPGAVPGANCIEDRLAMPGITNAAGCHLAARMRLAEWVRDSMPRRQIRKAACAPASAGAVVVSGPIP